jgi:hypothetical protein
MKAIIPMLLAAADRQVKLSARITRQRSYLGIIPLEKPKNLTAAAIF